MYCSRDALCRAKDFPSNISKEYQNGHSFLQIAAISLELLLFIASMALTARSGEIFLDYQLHKAPAYGPIKTVRDIALNTTSDREGELCTVAKNARRNEMTYR